MIRSFNRSAAAGVALAATFAWAITASADDAGIAPSPPPSSSPGDLGSGDDGGIVHWPGRSRADSTPASMGAAGTLVISGLVTLSLAYVPAFAMASQSTLPIDQRLYAPVAGPWIDLANRPVCGSGLSCSTEMANQALLVTDGIVQALGAAELLIGLMTLAADPSRTPSMAKVEDKPGLQVSPSQLGARGYGLVALGKF
ncbi:MAG TPA: hypothetical protein VH044_08560 [Polyangiaceae bacterium]|jgi:hypothetical protein|nr:hypothetical protein [Polyangiaceae bacterium]